MQSIPSLIDYYGKGTFPNAESMIEYFESKFNSQFNQIASEKYSRIDTARVENDYARDVYIRFLGNKMI